MLKYIFFENTLNFLSEIPIHILRFTFTGSAATAGLKSTTVSPLRLVPTRISLAASEKFAYMDCII